MKLTEIAPNRFRFVKPTTVPARSDLPRPFVISDEMPPTEQVDGRFYTSKAKFRATGRALGLTEVGTEKFKPRARPSSTLEARARRKEALRVAAAKFRAGHRVRSK
jgi:hypothetical protein